MFLVDTIPDLLALRGEIINLNTAGKQAHFQGINKGDALCCFDVWSRSGSLQHSRVLPKRPTEAGVLLRLISHCVELILDTVGISMRRVMLFIR